MQCFDSLFITKKCYLVIFGRITEKFASTLWLIVAVLTLVCCAPECSSRQSRLSVWRQSQLKLINIYNFLNIRLSNHTHIKIIGSTHFLLSLKLPVQQIHVVSLSLLHKLLIVQHESVGGEAHDVDHDDEHLRRQIHPLDAVHHLQNFAEKRYYIS